MAKSDNPDPRDPKVSEATLAPPDPSACLGNVVYLVEWERVEPLALKASLVVTVKVAPQESRACPEPLAFPAHLAWWPLKETGAPLAPPVRPAPPDQQGGRDLLEHQVLRERLVWVAPLVKLEAPEKLDHLAKGVTLEHVVILGSKDRLARLADQV